MADINATSGAIQKFRDALTRYRWSQRDVANCGDAEIDKTRASLEKRAGGLRSILAQHQAALKDCQDRAAAAAREGVYVNCSRFARAVAEDEERLDTVRRWQHRVEQEATAFWIVSNRFRDLLETDLPRTEAHLLAITKGLEAARGIQAPGA